MNHIIYFLGFFFLRDAIKPWFPVFRDTQLLLEWALTSSVLILIVLAVRRLFKEKLSARLRYALWGVVLLRLLVPFQVQLPAAAGDALPVLASNLAPEPPASWEERDVPVFPGGEVPIEEAHPYYQAFPPGYLGPGPWSDGCVSLSEDGKTVTPYADIFTRNEVIQSIWWVGVLGMAGALLVSNLRFFIRLEERRKQLEVPDPRVRVYVAEGLPSPCLFGVFKPAVYVTPEAAENPDTLRHVLAHELTHHAHKDHLWSLLRCLALALHWYDPLVWLAVVLSKQDGELACDEGAVARLGEAERIPYGRTLVDMVAARSPRPADLLSCSTAMTGGEKSIKQRVTQIVKKPETVKIALFAAVALVALAVVFTFAGRAQGEKGDYHTFLNDVENAQSIRLGQEITSSYGGPTITDPELLSQAKEILRDGASDWLSPRVLKNLDLGSMRTLTLTGQDGQEVRYQLVRFGDESSPILAANFCVLTEGSLSDIQDSRVAVLLKEDAVYQLDALTRQQGAEKPLMTPSSSPELEEFFAQLESAQSIYVGQPMISSANPPGLISDPEALARAKELLGKASAPLQLPEGVTREEFWKIIRPSLSNTKYRDMEEPPTITQEDLKDMLFMRGNPIVLCPGTEVTPDAEYRYWLADHMLLLLDEELEENPKALATFSDDVYSQLAELARTNGSRYRVDAAEYPEALEELIQLFVNDEDFLSQNAQAKNTTPEDIAAWLKGEGSEPIPLEVLTVHRGAWTMSAFGDGSLLFMDLTIPDHLIVQIQDICQSYGIELSW